MAAIETKLLRLANACGDLFQAMDAYNLYSKSKREDLNYHFILSLVACYSRPFTENKGIGSLLSDYPRFPDSTDEEMNQRHWYLIALRNQFFAHSSIVGIRTVLIPPSTYNPFTHAISTKWEIQLGKRNFSYEEYRKNIDWAYPIMPVLIDRIQNDIKLLLPKIGLKYRQATVPFDIDSRGEAFDLSAEVERLYTSHKQS